MTNKLITMAGKYAAKKVRNKTVNKAMEKISEPYEKFKKEVFGIKPLNVGERETIKCLQNRHNTLDYCKNIGNKVRKAYQKSVKYR